MSSPAKHWYKVPQKLVEQAVKNGFKKVPTEVALRPHDGDDVNKAFEAGGPHGAMNYRNRLISLTLCGVSYDPKLEKASRKACSPASPDPDCIPTNIFASLPGPLIALLTKAFTEINEADAEWFEDFLGSHSVEVA